MPARARQLGRPWHNAESCPGEPSTGLRYLERCVLGEQKMLQPTHWDAATRRIVATHGSNATNGLAHSATLSSNAVEDACSELASPLGPATPTDNFAGPTPPNRTPPIVLLFRAIARTRTAPPRAVRDGACTGRSFSAAGDKKLLNS